MASALPEPEQPSSRCSDGDGDEESGTSSELEMRMDYFTEYSLNTLEDVSSAIDTCKKAVLETEGSSESRKDLVQRLIKLRIRYFDLKERQENPIDAFETRGHSFVGYQDGPIPGVTATQKIYCQQCCSSIWVYLQASQHCRNCGFSVHTACIRNISRECVAEKVRTHPDLILQICPERSLPSLKYRCVECDCKLCWTDPAREPRLCDYTGLWFCSRCHWNARVCTPARIVHNWDFEARAVSQAAKQYLFLMWRKPFINVQQVNGRLFAVVPELNQVHHYRTQIMLIKSYLVVCRVALAQKLLLVLQPRQHFVDSADFYSIQDLVDTKSGELVSFLKRTTASFVQHVESCVLCRAKGFICELCDQGEVSEQVLFPFDETAASCPDCQTVFHKDCFRLGGECPKCKRIRERQQASS